MALQIWVDHINLSDYLVAVDFGKDGIMARKHEQACRYSGTKMGLEVLEDDCCCDIPVDLRAKMELKAATKALERAQARFFEAAAKVEQGTSLEDRLRVLSEGSVLRFTAEFQPTGPQYDYAAIKVGGVWSTTGPLSPKNYTSAQLAAWLEPKLVDELYVYTALRPIEELT